MTDDNNNLLPPQKQISNSDVYDKLKAANFLINEEDYNRAKPFIQGQKYRLMVAKVLLGAGSIESVFKKEIKTTWLYRIALYNKLVNDGKINGTPIVFETPNSEISDDYKETYNGIIQPIFNKMKKDEEKQANQTQNENANIVKFDKTPYYNEITLKISSMFLRGIGYVYKMLNNSEEKILLDIVKKIKNTGITEPQDISNAMLILITNAATMKNNFFDKLQAEDKAKDESNSDNKTPKKSLFDRLFGPREIVIAEPVKFVLLQEPKETNNNNSIIKGGKKTKKKQRKKYKGQKKSRSKV